MPNAFKYKIYQDDQSRTKGDPFASRIDIRLTTIPRRRTHYRQATGERVPQRVPANALELRAPNRRQERPR